MSKNIAVLIEDDIDLSEIFTKALERSGFEVEAFHDGHIASARLREIVPNVVVIDTHPPTFDGLDIVQQMRGDAAFDATTIFYIIPYKLSRHDSDLVENATVLVKPVLFAQLHELTAGLLVR